MSDQIRLRVKAIALLLVLFVATLWCTGATAQSAPPAPVMLTPAMNAYEQSGVAFTVSWTAPAPVTNGLPSYWQITDGRGNAFPGNSNLTNFSQNDTAGSAGSASLTLVSATATIQTIGVSLCNTSGCTPAGTNVRIQLTPALAATVVQSAVNLTVGTAIPNSEIAPVKFSGGSGSRSYAFIDSTGNLANFPAGLSLNSATGAIRGTPTEALGTTTYGILATDNQTSVTVRGFFTLTVARPMLATINASVPSLVFGTRMTDWPAVVASGGVTPYTYFLRDGDSGTYLTSPLSNGLVFNSTVSGLQLSGTPTAVGNYRYRVRAVDSHGLAVDSSIFTLVVASASNVISGFPTTYSLATSGTETLAATGLSGQPITYSVTSGSCTVFGNVLRAPATVGTCSVSANQVASGNYGAASAVQNVAVKKANTISSSTNGITLTVGGNAVLNASASSALAVTYTSNTPDVCTVNGSTLIGITAGSCTVTISQAGDANYLATVPVVMTLTVSSTSTAHTNKPDAPILASVANSAYGVTIPISWSVSGGSAPTSWTVYDKTQVLRPSSIQITANASGGWTGSTQVQGLAAADHSIYVRVCNVAGCTNSNTITFSVFHASAGLAVPAQPVITSATATRVNISTAMSVVWSLKNGQNGNYWQLYDGATLVLDQQPLTNAANSGAQSGTAQISLGTIGTHNLSVRVCNASGCTASAPYLVQANNPNGSQVIEPPSMPIFAVAPAQVTVGTTLTLRWSAAANANKRVGQYWQLFRNDTLVVQESLAGTGQFGQYTYVFDHAGMYSFTVRLCADSVTCTVSASQRISAVSPTSTTISPPGVPVVHSTRNSVVLGTPLTLPWLMTSGALGTYWYVKTNTGATVLAQQNLPAPVAGQVMQAAYGQVTLTSLGTTGLTIYLCNAAGCTPSEIYFVTVTAAPTTSKSNTVGDQGKSLEPTDQKTPAIMPPSKTPGVPVIRITNEDKYRSVTEGGSLLIHWGLWWGIQGDKWNLMDGEKPIAQGLPLRIRFGVNNQSGQYRVTNLSPGAHQFLVQVCNRVGCTSSKPWAIEVPPSSLLAKTRLPNPPLISSRTQRSGNFVTVYWSADGGAAGTSGKVFADGALVVQMNNLNAQLNQSGKQVFSTNSKKEMTITVQLCNNGGCATSAAYKIP